MISKKRKYNEFHTLLNLLMLESSHAHQKSDKKLSMSNNIYINSMYTIKSKALLIMSSEMSVIW